MMNRICLVSLALLVILADIVVSEASGSRSSVSRFLEDEGGKQTPYTHGEECVPCPGTTGECVIAVKVNFFASETGYYEFEGCEGVNPTLLLTVGRTYHFDQSDKTNWFHLLGFAYEADGAHVGVDELEPGIPVNSTCADTLSCPAPMYFMDGEYQGEYSNIPDLVPIPVNPSDNFGLDAVEPLFFHPLGDWQGYGTMSVYLNYDQEYDQDLFYFCHVHDGMSGRIKLVDSDGQKLNSEDIPELPYSYHEISDFDFECGTYNLTDWKLSTDSDNGPGDMCPSFFVCSEGGVVLSSYATCVEAMNCHMMASMTTTAEGSNSALFCHQMIPHHQNAVNMAKALLHAHPDVITCDTSGPVEEGDDQAWTCVLLNILYSIINDQNYQIMDMKNALSQLGVSEFANCDVSFNGLGAQSTSISNKISKRNLQESASSSTDIVSALDCEPCTGTTGECEIKMKVNLFAGEYGYYEVEGCEGVNPTLHLNIGRTYKFDQSDISNWYHLIGFSYFPDGAHVGVDELEPGIPVNSPCADTLSCPAPMYFMDGEYQGEFSNIPDLVPIPVNASDNFGLGVVEPLFFHPIGDWQGYGTMVAYLNFDLEYDQDLFYFCHLHAGMSGRIKLKDSNGNLLSGDENVPPIEYNYDVVTGHDAECGTFGLNDYQLPNDQCPSRFVCYDLGGTLLDFVKCIDSMDCAMLDGMTTFYGGDGISVESTNDVILFIRQMIPHHQNAVNMAKALLKSGEAVCDTSGPVEEGSNVSVGCLLEPMVRAIIANQNRQIQEMESILETFGIDPKNFQSNCDFTPSAAWKQTGVESDFIIVSIGISAIAFLSGLL
ncbi:protein of unknown function DUF305 containing protein [Nitzschia inconspicua]|uniref:DUF305 domain-containing protein n=1 Tax=Nitzschia inconspicua TaxID=303405 RepID=A0A9K3Q5I7_9STRA|nr:protein of unknown function DUF305 containing protein [Nitzschia inconspicua]